MNITILGAGIGSVSLAYFLQSKKNIKNITIVEKETHIGGLLRSYKINKIHSTEEKQIKKKKHLTTVARIRPSCNTNCAYLTLPSP